MLSNVFKMLQNGSKCFQNASKCFQNASKCLKMLSKRFKIALSAQAFMVQSRASRPRAVPCPWISAPVLAGLLENFASANSSCGAEAYPFYIRCVVGKFPRCQLFLYLDIFPSSAMPWGSGITTGLTVFGLRSLCTTSASRTSSSVIATNRSGQDRS